ATAVGAAPVPQYGRRLVAVERAGEQRAQGASLRVEEAYLGVGRGVIVVAEPELDPDRRVAGPHRVGSDQLEPECGRERRGAGRARIPAQSREPVGDAEADAVVGV